MRESEHHLVLGSATYVDSPVLPAELSHEPWSEDAARWRLKQLRPELPLAVPDGAVFAGGNANDAWIFDDLVLRICWRADRGRFLREAALLGELPEYLPHASVLAVGANDFVSWMLSPRLAGVPMLHVLAGLREDQRRSLLRDTAAIVRDLHEWQPSPELRVLLHDRPGLAFARPMSVWAADQVPLPLPRLLAQVPLAKAVPGMDSDLIDAAVDRIRSLAEHDPFTGNPTDHCVVHGDATLANFLVHEGRITALIDFEYARIGPRDLELLSPVLFGSGFGLDIWQEVYPELFSALNLRPRVWLYELCCALRGVIWWPPFPGESPSTHPPVVKLRALVDASTEW